MAEEVQRPRRVGLGRLRAYNQFPTQYASIQEMAKDLKRVKKMGFNSVWVNPVLEPCQSVFAAEVLMHGSPISKPGSPYAIRSFAINPKIHSANRESPVKAFKNYTDKARKEGLTPLCDLVMRHVAIDAIDQNDPDHKPLMETHPHWFKTEGGLPLFHGRHSPESEHPYAPIDGMTPWDDVIEFNYNDPQAHREIIDQYLKPMLKILIADLGFDGVRIDTAGEIPKDVYKEIIPYIDDLCRQKTPPRSATIALGETLGRSINDYEKGSGHLDYAYNSIAYALFPEKPGENPVDWHEDNSWFSQSREELQKIAPTVGFVGSHDTERYAKYLLDRGLTTQDAFERAAKEALCFAAFASDGGWFLHNGDEYGVTKKTDVFTASPEDFAQRAFPNTDFSAFIRQINTVVQQLPEPVDLEWAQRCYLNDPEKDKALASFQIHQGYSFRNKANLVIANVQGGDSRKPFILDKETFEEIMSANGRNSDENKIRHELWKAFEDKPWDDEQKHSEINKYVDNTKTPFAIYLCGNISISQDLNTYLRSKKIQINYSTPGRHHAYG